MKIAIAGSELKRHTSTIENRNPIIDMNERIYNDKKLFNRNKWSTAEY